MPAEEDARPRPAVRMQRVMPRHERRRGAVPGRRGEAPEAEPVRMHPGERLSVVAVVIITVRHFFVLVGLRVRVVALHDGDARARPQREPPDPLRPLRQRHLALGHVGLVPVLVGGGGGEPHDGVSRCGRLLGRVGPVDDETCGRLVSIERGSVRKGEREVETYR